MNKIKRIAISIMVAFGFAVPAMVPAVAGAQDIQGALCDGANFSFSGEGSEECDEGTAGTAVDNIVEKVINILSLVVGIVAVIMIIIGGFKYITSNGDSGNVTGAKNTILYAVVGLVIVAVAQIIVRFVVGSTTDIENG